MLLDTLNYAKYEQLTQVIDLIPVSIYCKNLDGAYLQINQTSLDAMINWGYLPKHVDRQAIVGKTDFDLFSQETAERFKANDLEIIRSRKVVTVEENNTLPSSGILKQVSTKKPLLNADNKVIGIMGATLIIPKKDTSIPPLLLASLSNREKECLFLYLQGKTSKETAYKLNISFRTVEGHFEHIKDKLNCMTKRELLVYRDLL